MLLITYNKVCKFRVLWYIRHKYCTFNMFNAAFHLIYIAKVEHDKLSGCQMPPRVVTLIGNNIVCAWNHAYLGCCTKLNSENEKVGMLLNLIRGRTHQKPMKELQNKTCVIRRILSPRLFVYWLFDLMFLPKS